MIFVIQVSLHDLHLLPKFVKNLKLLGNLEAHRGILVPTEPVAAKATEMASGLSEVFGRYEVLPLAIDSSDDNGNRVDWPFACNRHFQHTVIAVNPVIDGAWTLLELDVTPVDPQWANKWSNQYSTCGKPHMGVRRNTGDFIQGETGFHINGVMVYPKSFHDANTLWKYPNREIPWDINMRYSIEPFAHATSLMEVRPHSHSYIKDIDGKIHGTDEDGNLFSLGPDVVMVHGCKSESLVDLMLGYAKPAPRFVLEAPKKRTELSLEEMADKLRDAGYEVLEPISEQAYVGQGDPVPVEGLTIHETKPVSETRSLPKRGRPSKVK